MENAKPTTSPDDLNEKDAQNLDICFLLDCTGSMQPYIDLARDKIKDTIKEVKSQYPDSDIRIAIVGHRDVKDKERFTIFDFSESVDEARSFLEGIKADGGHDIPEDMNGGFRNVLYTLKWKYFTRMLYHITDAPCHGRAYHSELDNFPKGHSEDIDWKIIFGDIISMNINYVFMKIHKRTDKMMEEFKKIYNAAPKSDLDLIFNIENLVIQKEEPKYDYNSYAKLESTPITRSSDMKECAAPKSISTTASISSSSKPMKMASYDVKDLCDDLLSLESAEKCYNNAMPSSLSYKSDEAMMMKKENYSPMAKKESKRSDDFVHITAYHAQKQIAFNMDYIQKKKK